VARLRIATFNVNSVRSRLPILERWLPGSGVDMLFLQETKAVDQDFPAAALASLGYSSAFHGEKSYNGVAVLFKGERPDVSFGFGDGEQPDFSTRVLLARTPKLSVLNTYVPQGKEITNPDYESKKAFLDRVGAFCARECENEHALFAWVGDMNVAPTEMDVTHPEGKKNHVCFHIDIREKFAETARGMTDLLRRFNPGEGVFTFFDYRVKDAEARGIGWRIDHVMVNGALAARASGCFADRATRGWDKPSDHVPVVADFDI
jgi:exodeoxyribonuclease-3